MRGARLAWIWAALLAGLPAAPPGGAAQPATAAQVAALVTASHRITTLPRTVAAELPTASRDWWTVPYPRSATCPRLGACAFGDVSSPTTVVLFGDSHAAMWLPALAPAASRLRVRLLLVYKELCPAAELVTFSYSGEPTTPGCAAFRSQAIAAIRLLAPAAVLVGEQTAEIFATPRRQRFTAAQWRAALAATLRQLAARSAVGVLEDVPYFDTDPPTCLAASPEDIQVCAVRDPNPARPEYLAAEAAAAHASGAVYVRTVPWLCRATCSPVIGAFVPYVDAGHVSARYATYLAGVMASAVRGLLRARHRSATGSRAEDTARPGMLSG